MTTQPQPPNELTSRPAGSAVVALGPSQHHITAESVEAARPQVIQALAAHAAHTGGPVQAITHDTGGTWPITVHSDGRVTDPTSLPHEEPASQSADVAGPQPAPAPPTRRERQSFLTREQADEPAAHGWRAALGTVGIRLKPSAAEQAQRSDEQAVSQHWPGPRTIAIVNGKGGAGKTPTTILLASVFARYGGAGVLAWDNNQTPGTLGGRTEQGPHEATLHHLPPQVDHLVGTSARSADLAHYVHHQSRDQYDVLRSKPMQLAADQRIDPSDVDAIHQVASKYYRLVFIDSGNDESDPMWLRMIDHADQVVVATPTRDDHAEAGALLLEELTRRGDHGARLAAGAVAVVTQADSHAPRRDAQRIAQGYQA